MIEGDPSVTDWQVDYETRNVRLADKPPDGFVAAGPWFPFAVVTVTDREEGDCPCTYYRRPLRKVSHVETSPRGFPIYGRVSCNEGTIRVKRSSGIEAAVWLFSDSPRRVTIGDEKFVPEPSLNVDQARAMIAALQAFVDDVGEKR